MQSKYRHQGRGYTLKHQEYKTDTHTQTHTHLYTLADAHTQHTIIYTQINWYDCSCSFLLHFCWILMCNKMLFSVFRFDCSKIYAKTNISNQKKKKKKSKPLQKVVFENV